MMNLNLSQVIGQPVFDTTSSVKDFMKSKIDKLEVEEAFATVDLS